MRSLHPGLWAGSLLLLALASCSPEKTRWDFQSPQDLADWKVLGEGTLGETIFSTLKVRPDDGVLQAVADTGSWYGSTTGGLVYRVQDGDFVATARLNVYGAEGPLPKGTFELAGLMLRKAPADPKHDTANWEYIVTGGSNGGRMIDFKTTRDSVSTFLAHEAQGPWIEVRLERRGPQVAKFWREDGGAWQLAETQDRPDLTGPMQVGLCYLTNWDGDSDLHADVDWVSIEPVPAGNSEFTNQTDLAAWTALEITNWDEQAFGSRAVVADEGGVLRVTADHGTWYQASTGGLLYQTKKGDFVVTTRLKVYGAAGPLPNGSFELTGLMVRQPGLPSDAKLENWEYLVTGADFGQQIVDYKTTKNSASVYATADVQGTWVELKVARLGDSIVKLWRPENGSWHWAETQKRPDLKGDVEVGLCFLTNFIGESDLHADVDWVRWSRPPHIEVAEPTADQWLALLSVD